MKRSYTPVLAVGIGAVAGLRTLTAPAVLAWAAKYKWIRLGDSPFAALISAKASKRISDFAVSELIADKLPFTPSRLNAGPLASRIVMGCDLRGDNLWCGETASYGGSSSRRIRSNCGCLCRLSHAEEAQPRHA